jgi:hypothetical protein
VVIGSLALGIGASVTVFSVVRAVLLDPYPYKDADRMVHVELTRKNSGQQSLLSVTATEYTDLLQLPSVDDVFLMDNRMQALKGDTLPVSVTAGFYSPNLFTYMGVPPLLGGSSLRQTRRVAMPVRLRYLAICSGRSNTEDDWTSSARRSNWTRQSTRSSA